MKLIDTIRADDDLSEFGELLRFVALVYENEDEGEANAPFAPNNIDGDVVFPGNRQLAEAAFEAWVRVLQDSEDQFLDEGEEEAFVALFNSPKGLMIIAGSTLAGYPNPDLNALLPGAKNYLGMPHVSWARIVNDMW